MHGSLLSPYHSCLSKRKVVILRQYGLASMLPQTLLSEHKKPTTDTERCLSWSPNSFTHSLHELEMTGKGERHNLPKQDLSTLWRKLEQISEACYPMLRKLCRTTWDWHLYSFHLPNSIGELVMNPRREDNMARKCYFDIEILNIDLWKVLHNLLLMLQPNNVLTFLILKCRISNLNISKQKRIKFFQKSFLHLFKDINFKIILLSPGFMALNNWEREKKSVLRWIQAFYR